MGANLGIKIAISIAAVALLIVRIIYPEISIDAITLGLLILAVLPWLSSLIESAEFPGGWKVKFRDIQEAGKKVAEGATTPSSEPDVQKVRLQFDSSRDPNLALVALRIEIEKRLRAIAERNGIQEPHSLRLLSRELQNRGILADSSVSGLQELIDAGNKAAHGASVDPRVSDWATDYGPNVLAALDSKLR